MGWLILKTRTLVLIDVISVVAVLWGLYFDNQIAANMVLFWYWLLSVLGLLGGILLLCSNDADFVHRQATFYKKHSKFRRTWVGFSSVVEALLIAGAGFTLLAVAYVVGSLLVLSGRNRITSEFGGDANAG